jgi:hypothetical protein
MNILDQFLIIFPPFWSSFSYHNGFLLNNWEVVILLEIIQKIGILFMCLESFILFYIAEITDRGNVILIIILVIITLIRTILERWLLIIFILTRLLIVLFFSL